eukprot:GHRQ01024994.1.p1 GENE.GHRQ01024994.1~~GHRQ01024994.1.p1  ORF type:complete len:118 (-),score=18.11 GHRQ01024994.1:49-402(-)
MKPGRRLFSVPKIETCASLLRQRRTVFRQIVKASHLLHLQPLHAINIIAGCWRSLGIHSHGSNLHYHVMELHPPSVILFDDINSSEGSGLLQRLAEAFTGHICKQKTATAHNLLHAF